MSDVLKIIKEKDIEYVDLRFTDPRGKLQHVTMDAKMVDEEMLNEGIFFDGSSIAGWKAINESDMILKPDTSRAIVDPFTSHNTLNLFCSIGHDTSLGDYTTLSSHVDITGRCKIGKLVFWGSGSRIIPDKFVADGCKIGAGSLVMHNISGLKTVYCPPSKTMQF